jgi:hypothetical protein
MLNGPTRYEENCEPDETQSYELPTKGRILLGSQLPALVRSQLRRTEAKPKLANGVDAKHHSHCD